ncbi:MAG: hypothetical protein JWP01_3375 [Myxococcales bacterium]|nr:hypothetical protein [Myxococcales bacterium]
MSESPELDEARLLIRTLVASRTDDDEVREARIAANEKLFEEILQLDGYAGMKIARYPDPHECALVFKLKGAEAWITFVWRGGHAIAPSHRKVPLGWNVITNTFEGIEPDTFRTPVPGEPVSKRSAANTLLAALIEDFPKPKSFR